MRKPNAEKHASPQFSEFVRQFVIHSDLAIDLGLITHRAQMFSAFMDAYAQKLTPAGRKPEPNYERGQPGMRCCVSCGAEAPLPDFKNETGRGPEYWDSCRKCRTYSAESIKQRRKKERMPCLG